MVSFALYTIRHRTLCLNNFPWQKSYLTIYIIFECHCAQLTLLELNTDVWATENLIGLMELTLTWLLTLVLLVSQLAAALHWRFQCKFSRAKKGRQQGRGKFVQPRWMLTWNSHALVSLIFSVTVHISHFFNKNVFLNQNYISSANLNSPITDCPIHYLYLYQNVSASQFDFPFRGYSGRAS